MTRSVSKFTIPAYFTTGIFMGLAGVLVGLAIVLVNGLLMLFGPDTRHANLPYGFDSYEVANVLIDKVRVYAAAAALVAFGRAGAGAPAAL
jgi:hypothetical protein